MSGKGTTGPGHTGLPETAYTGVDTTNRIAPGASLESSSYRCRRERFSVRKTGVRARRAIREEVSTWLR